VAVYGSKFGFVISSARVSTQWTLISHSKKQSAVKTVICLFNLIYNSKAFYF